MAKVLFSHGSQAQYNALSNKLDNTLYVITDTGRIYKGTKKVSDVSVRVVNTVPEYSSALEEVLYVVIGSDSNKIYIKDSNSKTVVPLGGSDKITSIDMFDESVLVKSTESSEDGSSSTLIEGDDSTIPTSGSVIKAIKEQLVEYSGYAFVGVEVTRVEADDDNSADGTLLKFKHADGVGTSEVRISDLFLAGAKYDSETHILSLAVQGESNPVEVDLKDLVSNPLDTDNVSLTVENETISLKNFGKQYYRIVEVLDEVISEDELPADASEETYCKVRDSWYIKETDGWVIAETHPSSIDDPYILTQGFKSSLEPRVIEVQDAENGTSHLELAWYERSSYTKFEVDDIVQEIQEKIEESSNWGEPF